MTTRYLEILESASTVLAKAYQKLFHIGLWPKNHFL